MVVVAVGTGTLLATRSSDGGGGAGNAASGDSGALAVLEVIDERIQVRTGSDREFRVGETGTALDVGDQVRSNESGFGELGYFDGSWMRIEASATLTIDELQDVEGARVVEASIDGGRIWARAEELTGSDDRFEVDTPVGTASVHGTRFSIDCAVEWPEGEPPADTSAFTVIDGTVVVQDAGGDEFTLTAAQRLLVPSDDRAPIGPTQLVPDELYLDPWVAKNLGVDVEKADAEQLLGHERAGSTGSAALASDWDAEVHVVSSTDPRFAVGASDRARWNVAVRCPTPDTCRSERLVVDDASGPAVTDSRGAPVIDVIEAVGPGRYELRAQWADRCERDGRVLSPVGVVVRKVGTYEVSETDFRDGRWVATELRGTVTTTTELSQAGRDAGCALPGNVPSVAFTTEVVATA